MAFYDVILKPSVEKDLRALSATVRARVLARLEHLRGEPIPRQAVKLAGGEAWYRVRMGDYRIIYGVDTRARQITVHDIRHRRDVYRMLVQGTLDDTVTRHTPVPLAASRGEFDVVPRYAKGQQVVRTRPLPLFPVAQPDASSMRSHVGRADTKRPQVESCYEAGRDGVGLHGFFSDPRGGELHGGLSQH